MWKTQDTLLSMNLNLSKMNQQKLHKFPKLHQMEASLKITVQPRSHGKFVPFYFLLFQISFLDSRHLPLSRTYETVASTAINDQYMSKYVLHYHHIINGWIRWDEKTSGKRNACCTQDQQHT